MKMTRFLRSGDGYSFIELVVATFIISILASAALPLARVSMKRQREAECHRDLREMRLAIDKFKDEADRAESQRKCCRLAETTIRRISSNSSTAWCMPTTRPASGTRTFAGFRSIR